MCRKSSVLGPNLQAELNWIYKKTPTRGKPLVSAPLAEEQAGSGGMRQYVATDGLRNAMHIIHIPIVVHMPPDRVSAYVENKQTKTTFFV
jgi:hypothetical protein